MPRQFIFLACFFCLISVSYAQLPLGFVEELWADSLNPVAMTMDHHGRIWLVEKHGEVRIIDEEGHLLPDPFIQLEVDDFNERGLLGIALHPDIDNFPYVYLYYTVPSETINRLSRFRANGDLAIPGSEEVLLETGTLSGAIHNGGALAFDQQGYLYLATGDAGNSSDAPNFNSLHGKVLRLHDDGSIPIDNPFYQTFAGYRRAIYAYGLRNPFSITFDSASGRLFACDVGSGEYEEVNEILPGKNYGWPLVEGPCKMGKIHLPIIKTPFMPTIMIKDVLL